MKTNVSLNVRCELV